MDSRISMESVGNELWEEMQSKLRALVEAYPDVGQQHYDKVRCNMMPSTVRAAAMEGNIDVLMVALEERCHEERSPLPVVLDQWTLSRNTLLHVAAASSSDRALRLILNHFSDQQLVATNGAGDTALHVAVRSGSLGQVEMLVQRMKSVGGPNLMLRWKNNAGNTPLHEAVRKHNHEVSRRLLEEDAEPLFLMNKQAKSPIYLAVEIGSLEILNLLLSENTTTTVADQERFASKVEGISPAHATIAFRHLDMMIAMWEKKPSLLPAKEYRGRNLLHFAVVMSYGDGIKFLLREFPSMAIEYDVFGYLPIHVACMSSSVSVIRQLLKGCENPMDLLNEEGQNIMHVAAKYGRTQVVKYLLRQPKLEALINHQDYNGNTALHLAAAYFQPKTLLVLTWDTRVKIALPNNECESPIDVLIFESPTEVNRYGRRWLAYLILRSAGARRSTDLLLRLHGEKQKQPFWRNPTLDQLKSRISTQLIVATLIATVTFAAGFTIPGGFYGSESKYKGLAILADRRMFQAFVICNTIATYSSILAITILLWSLPGMDDPHTTLTVYAGSIPPLTLAIVAISGAFMAGIYPALGLHHRLQNAVLVISIIFTTMICCFSLGGRIPVTFESRFIRRFTYYIFLIAILINGGCFISPLLEVDEEEKENARPSEWNRLHAPANATNRVASKLYCCC